MAELLARLGPRRSLVGRAWPPSLKPGTSHVQYTRALPSSAGGVGQDTTGKAHESSDFHDQQVPSCYSIEGMIHGILTGSGRVFSGAIGHFLAYSETGC